MGPKTRHHNHNHHPKVQSPPITLGYWNVRGLSQHIRNMLAYVGADYLDKRYEFDLMKGIDAKKLSDYQATLGDWPHDRVSHRDIIGSESEPPLEFPNLPYYIEALPDGSKFKLTQSTAIARHIARKFGLVVDDELEISKMDMYEQQACDLRRSFINYCFDNSVVNSRYPNFLEDIGQQIYPWTECLKDRQWLMGDKLTYVDFILFEVLDWFEYMQHDYFNRYPVLKAYMERFRELTEMRKFFDSPAYKEWPILGPFAPNFGFDETQRDK